MMTSTTNPDGVHQRTMSAEEGEETDQQQLPLLDPNASIRPLEMDLGALLGNVLLFCLSTIILTILLFFILKNRPLYYSRCETSRRVAFSVWRGRNLVCLLVLWFLTRRCLSLHFRRWFQIYTSVVFAIS